MCTVTWRRDGERLELFFNRDESRARSIADPPEVDSLAGVRRIAPRDRDGGGSWISANELGLIVCLLNGPPPNEPSSPAFRSRGLLVLDLSDAESPCAVAARLRSSSLAAYRPFTLAALASGPQALAAEWDGYALRVSLHDDLRPPLISSSFATEVVRRRRHEVFAGFFGGHTPATRESFLDYHQSHLPARGPESVCMHRTDAATVSLSEVEVGPRRVRFRYLPNAPCAGRADESTIEIDRRI